MTAPESIELSASQAATLLQQTLFEADQGLRVGDRDRSFDNYVRALGLGLQLGPAPTETALLAILTATDHLAKTQDSQGLCTLGPALVALVDDVRATGALPPTPAMNTWATVVSEVGTLAGQIGLALAIPPERRSEILGSARTRAQLMDDATSGRFELAEWIERILVA